MLNTVYLYMKKSVFNGNRGARRKMCYFGITYITMGIRQNMISFDSGLFFKVSRHKLLSLHADLVGLYY